MYIVYKDSIFTSRRPAIRITNLWTMQTGAIAVYYVNYTEHINALCW